MAWAARRTWLLAGALAAVLGGVALGLFLRPKGDPITLRITHPPVVYAAVPASFDASDSTVTLSPARARAAQIRYRWEFSDGGTSQSGTRVEHAFADVGDHQVRLVAEVITGSRYRALALDETVTVRALPAPEVSIARPAQLRVRAGEPVEFAALASFSPLVSSEAEPQGWEYAWLFGDDQSRPRGESVSHQFSLPGTYLVNVSAAARYAGGTSETGTTQQEVVVVPAAPAISPQAKPNASGQRVLAHTPVVFEVATAKGTDGSALLFEWDFDGDGFTDVGPISKTRVQWKEGFARAGEHHVTVKTWDAFAIEYDRPVTEVLTVYVDGHGAGVLSDAGPVVVSAGGYSLGALSMAGGSAGWSFDPVGISALAGYYVSTEAVNIDRTADFPDVAAAGMHVTTHIEEATAVTLTGTYALGDPWTLGATVGLMTLEGEHQASCRCLIGGALPPVPFEEQRILVGVGVGLRLGFAIFLLQFVTSL